MSTFRNRVTPLAWVKYCRAMNRPVRNTLAVVKSILQARKSPIRTWNIVRGDTVQVINGKFTGQQGVVKAVLRKKNQLVIKGINRVNRVLRLPTGDGRVMRKGVVRENPVHYSNVQLVDPETGLPTKVKRRRVRCGHIRVSKTTGAMIPKTKARKPQPFVNSTTDTPAEEAIKATYAPLWRVMKPRLKPQLATKIVRAERSERQQKLQEGIAAASNL